MNRRPDSLLPAAIWAGLPEQARELIAARRAYIELLEGRIREVDSRIQELEARLAQDSQNSSRAPSSDPPGVRRSDKRASGRKQGGQPGHPGSHRISYSQAEVDETVEVRPSTCEHCHAPIGIAGEPEDRYRSHQVAELPEIKSRVTEGCG